MLTPELTTLLYISIVRCRGPKAVKTAILTNVTYEVLNAAIESMEKCLQNFTTYPYAENVGYCNATFDNFICWPPTEAGATVYKNCPDRTLSDPKQLAFRRCGNDSTWLGKNDGMSDATGWTNFTPCFPPEIRDLFARINEGDAEAKFDIAHYTRRMEIVGFTISLLALVISLVIFSRFRSLRNNRTKIHRNLFFAMTTQVVVRLVIYLDQAFSRTFGHNYGLSNMPYICESFYVLLEYGISAMFCWMFIEGLYLHNVVTANALRETISYRQYCFMGWGVPIIITIIWASFTSYHYFEVPVLHCWYAYNFLLQYWVCQGPRLGMVMVNLVFLLNIMRVLIVKLNQSENSELKKLRKAVRAALVLLPLLGITNALNMIEGPLDGSVFKFGLWSYSTHFLRSFQGFFIALIYCFMNGEVRQVVSRMYRDWSAMRNDRRRTQQATRANRRMSLSRTPWPELSPPDWIHGTSNNEDALADADIELDCETSERRELCTEDASVDNDPPTRFEAVSNNTDIV